MSNGSAISSDIVDEAIGWMIASREGLTGEEHSALHNWLDADARHRLAWKRLEGSLSPFRVVEAQNLSGQRLVASLAQQRISRRALIGNGTMGLAALATSVGVLDRLSPIDGLFADYSTATGQRRRFLLPDGSALTLDARSEASLDFQPGRRGIVLGSGTAFLSVSPYHNPFTIGSGDALVSLDGGSVMVSNRLDVCRVICGESGADLALKDGEKIAVPARQGIAIQDGKMRALPREETQDAASWIDGKLIFHDRQLGDLIDAFRPYRAGILSISAEASKLRVSGVFNLDRFENVLTSITELFPVRVMQIGKLFARIDLMRAVA